MGRLTGIWAPSGDLVSFLYDAGGRLTAKWFPNGVATQYTWNPDNTLAQVLNYLHRTLTLVSQHDYTYDGVGNRATHTENVAGFLTPYRYGYDPLNRLTEVRNSSTGALLESYTYDPLGNRTSKTNGATLATVAYVHDPAHQLTEIRQGSATGTLLGGLVYDPAGNAVKKCESGTVTVSASDCTGTTITGLSYDALNRLSQVTKTGLSTQSYLYDDQGRRIQKTIGGTPTNYLYNGPDIVSQYEGTWTSATAVFTHGPQMDDPLIRATSADVQYYHQDGLGSVVASSLPDGTAAGLILYDAWGNTRGSAGTIPLYGYTGREPDETGLIYYRARYYDPTLGRFTQRDPSGFAGGLNPYAYVANNPVKLTDPMGLEPFDPAQHMEAQANQGYTSLASGLTSGRQSLGSLLDAFSTPTGSAQGGLPLFAAGPCIATCTDTAGNMIEGIQAVNQRLRQQADAVLPSFIPRWLVNSFLPVEPSEIALQQNLNLMGLAAPIAGPTTTAARAGVTLFRAVGPAELADITAAGGVYRTAAGAVEGKYFYPTVEQAAAFAKAMYPKGGPYTITATQVPQTVMQGATTLSVAGEGPVIFVPRTLLPFGPVQILNHAPLP